MQISAPAQFQPRFHKNLGLKPPEFLTFKKQPEMQVFGFILMGNLIPL